jgi:hypothetical protein
VKLTRAQKQSIMFILMAIVIFAFIGILMTAPSQTSTIHAFSLEQQSQQKQNVNISTSPVTMVMVVQNSG